MGNLTFSILDLLLRTGIILLFFRVKNNGFLKELVFITILFTYSYIILNNLKTVYDFSKKSKLSFDLTYFTYLTQQAGGLNDTMFALDPFQSNRKRNWFSVDWLLYNLTFNHNFRPNKSFSINSLLLFFGSPFS